MCTQPKLFVWLLLLVLITCSQFLHAQISTNSQWSWRNGQPNGSMVRGPKGKPSSAYNPGNRAGAAQFVDPDGNVWIYGGLNGSTIYADLWFFNIQTDEWTWVSGSDATNTEPVFGTFRNGDFTTYPGARFESYSWYDPANGKLWLYGGGTPGTGANWRNDLWSYDLQSGIWTWMAGSTNKNVTRQGTNIPSPTSTPGARSTGASWYVYNSLNPLQSFYSYDLPARNCAKLYLGFGYLYGYGQAKDIWVFTTDDNTWEFLGDTPYTITNGMQPGPYNKEGPATWVRNEDFGTAQTRAALYCYGGFGNDRNIAWGGMNDMWKYDVKDNKWYYVSGSLYVNPPADGTNPGTTWKVPATISNDQTKAYLYGTQGNEVWEYNYSLAQWKKLSAAGALFYGIQTSQGPQVRPGWGSNAPFWYGKNRLYTYNNGNTLCFFDPCNTNSISASQTAVSSLSDSVTFTCTATGSGPIYYLWRKNGQVASLVSSPTFKTAGILPTDVFSCFVTTAAGCASDIRFVSYSNNLLLNCLPPANDQVCNATELVLDAALVSGNNDYATVTGEPGTACYSTSNTVWYKYTPSVSGNVQFTLGAGPSGDTLNSWLSVFTASGNCPSSLTLVDNTASIFGGCRYYHAPANKNPAVWSGFLQAGTTYYFRLSGLYGDVGRYALSIQSAEAATTKAGNWYDPAIWSNNKVPTAQSSVTVSQPVIVDSNAVCKTLNVENGATITVQEGKSLSVLSDPSKPPGAALAFDGINDYVYIPHNNFLKPATGITIEAWIKPVDIHTPTFAEIYRKEDGDARQLFSFQNNGTILSFGLNVGGVYSELDVPINRLDYEGQWVHVAATFDGKTKKIYRNSVLIGSQSVTGLMSTAGTAPAIIGSLGGYAEFFNGSIDEFRLWDHAIAIENNLSCELPNTQTGLLLYYKFNQGTAGAFNGSVNRVFDASGNNWDGFLQSFSLSGTTSNWITPGGVQTGFSCTLSH
jgi:hypothetical protein